MTSPYWSHYTTLSQRTTICIYSIHSAFTSLPHTKLRPCKIRSSQQPEPQFWRVALCIVIAHHNRCHWFQRPLNLKSHQLARPKPFLCFAFPSHLNNRSVRTGNRFHFLRQAKNHQLSFNLTSFSFLLQHSCTNLTIATILLSTRRTLCKEPQYYYNILCLPRD